MKEKIRWFIIIGVLYWLLPDLMPGIPIDDIVVAVICVLADKKAKNKQVLLE